MAFGSPAAERAAIESTYEDTATVYRTAPKRGANRPSASVPTWCILVSFARCRIQVSNSSMQTNAQQNIDHDAVVFAGPDLKVLPGDTIVVKRFGRDDPSSTQEVTFEVVGRPSVYATHQEIKVKDGDLS